MKRLLLIATVVAAAVSLGVLAALPTAPARSVPAIELGTPSTTTGPTTTAGSARERAEPGRSDEHDGPAASQRNGGGASPAPPPLPAPAGGGDDDDDGEDDGDDD
jgi:hypothetical protein